MIGYLKDRRLAWQALVDFANDEIAALDAEIARLEAQQTQPVPSPATIEGDVVEPDPVTTGGSVSTSPAPAPAPAQQGWEDAVRALRTASFGGQPVASATLVVRDARTVDGWRHKSPPTTIQRCVDVYSGGDLTLTNFEILGADGMSENKAGVICRPGGVADLIGGRIDAMSADWIKIGGRRGGVQTVRGVHFGPQWATVGSTTHADMITFLAVEGIVEITDCLFDRVLAPGRRIAGLNNWLRIVPNSGSGTSGGAGEIRVRRCVVESDALQSFLIQMTTYADGVPFLDLEDCLLPVSRIGASKLFHPSSNLSRVRWVNIRDTYTGEPVPAPDPRMVQS